MQLCICSSMDKNFILRAFRNILKFYFLKNKRTNLHRKGLSVVGMRIQVYYSLHISFIQVLLSLGMTL